ncbi:EAL domain-containing protein [Rhodoferax saidenbachensis]|uniref:GGDEF domain-containing protein n=1 Tax=Rhodoferax saidenbachensis TaxID=1484693 RepID=A0A1P8KDW5_9BURK|nr:EAL domain-containing protein [Rhodoferax saidenbachensis]APW44227.1 hypothetical protein RS694_17955 [Rhodoferax saidenbachensis]
MKFQKPVSRESAEWLAFAAVVLLGCALSVFAVLSERNFILKNEHNRLEAQARIVDENLRRQLAGVRSALDSIRKAHLENSPGATGLSIQALRNAMPGVRALALLDKNGHILQSSDEMQDSHLDDADFLRSISKMRDAGTVYVSRPYENTPGTSNIKLSMKVESPPGDTPGVATAILNPAYFDVVMQSVIYAPDMWSSISQRDGFVVLFVPPSLRPGAAIPGLSVVPDDSRMVVQRTIDATQANLDKELVVAVSRSYQEISKPWIRLAIELASLWCVFVLIVGPSIWLLQVKRRSLSVLTEKRAKDAAENAERMELALAGARLGLWDQALPSGLLQVDERAASILGHVDGQPRTILNWRDEIHPDDLDNVVLAFDRHLSGETPRYEAEYRLRHVNGCWVWVQARGKIVERDRQGRPVRILGTRADISASKRHESEIQQLAFYDGLTGLPNRRLLMDRISRAVNLSHRNRQAGAIMFIDLDNFKDLNDTLGHDKGDLLLAQVAARLLEVTRKTDTVARLGGDEFVVLLEELGASDSSVSERAEQIGQNIVQRLSTPYLLSGHEVYSTPSVGVAMFGADTESIDDLMKQADLAMYEAKAAGRNALRLFSPQMQTQAAASVALERDLRGAIARNELHLHYQPIVDADRTMTGVEALVRWNHPRHGPVSPAEFIPLAEKSGLILQIGQWVMEQACEQIRLWGARPESRRLTVSVNISARQMRQPDFVGQVISVLSSSGANPFRLRFELTESMLFSDTEDVIEKMNDLKAMGVGFSLDDFGTGYSSLSYLKRLPLDQLKIDQSFIREALTHTSDATIAKAIVGLAHSLGMLVVAEGVETEAQHTFLAQSHCDSFQGYLYAPPCSAERITALLNTQGLDQVH